LHKPLHNIYAENINELKNSNSLMTLVYLVIIFITFIICKVFLQKS